MTKTLFLTVACLSIVGVGCNKKPDKPAEEKPEVQQKDLSAESMEGKSPMNLIPHEVGDQWVYENGTGQEVTFKISKSKKVGDNVEFSMEVTVDGEVRDRTDWRIGPKGFFQTASRSGKKFNPPLPIISFPIKFDEPLTYKGSGPFPGASSQGNQKVAIRVRGVETVSTLMGEMEALAIESITAFEVNGVKAQTTARLWITPDYGIVRYAEEIRTSEGANGGSSLKLKSFTGKGKK